MLTVIDAPPPTFLDVLAAAQEAAADASADEVDLDPAHALIERLGWSVQPDGPEVARLAAALGAVQDAELLVPAGGLEQYAAAVRELAEIEVDTVPTDQVDAAVRQVALGTVLIEPVLLALRRLAQQDVSAARFGLPT